MLHAGKGIARDEVAALRWFDEAARNGHAAAQYILGAMYRAGTNLTQDLDEARRWFRLAAAQGHEQARAALAALSAGG